MQRILHVIAGVPPNAGGPSEAVYGMAKSVAPFGCVAEVATTDSAIWGNIDVPIGEKINHRGVPTIFFHSTRLRKYGYSSDLASWLDRHVNGFDLVHIHGVFAQSSLAAMRAARKHEVPFIIRPAGELEPWCVGKNRLLKRAALSMMKRYMSRATFHATCRMEAESIKREIGDVPVYVIAHGVNPPSDVSLLESDCPRSGNNGKKTILFLSRIDPVKGLEHLIRAIQILRGKRSDFSLQVAGSGAPDYECVMKKLVADLGLQWCVTFSGHLDSDKKWEAFRKADLFVLPSFSENFGIAVAEALFMGVPVIISKDIGISGDVVEYEAGLISDRDPLALARAIETLLDDEASRNAMRLNAKRLATERYSWGTIGSRLVDVYRKILGGNGA